MGQVCLGPTFGGSLSNNSYSVNEGSTASFTLTTKNLASGTSVPYTLSGVSATDISNGSLNGSVVINSNGIGTISIGITNDLLQEGPENLTVSAGGASASTVVNDTSVRASLIYDMSSEVAGLLFIDTLGADTFTG